MKNNIPHISHQIWIGNEQMPKQFQEWRNRFIKLHPKWEYILWNNENIVELEAEELLEECESYAEKSDVLRLLVVAKYGGVYFDIDFECLKPITPLLNVPAFGCRIRKNYLIGNCLFGATKNHDWLLKQIDLLPIEVLTPIEWGSRIMSEDLSGVTLYPEEFFFPFLWDIPKEFRIPKKDTYMIHHWNKSWLTP